MKKFLIIIAVFALIINFGCEKDYEAPNEFSDISWITSLTKDYKTKYDTFFIKENDMIAFADLSYGALSHEWTISEGNHFLFPDYTTNDTVFTDFINPSAGLKSNEDKIHVLFSAPGFQKVRLYNIFKDSVTFKGGDTLSAVQNGDEWIIDTTFTVKVFAKPVPAFKVFKEPIVETVEPGEEPSEEAEEDLGVQLGEEVLSVSTEDMVDMNNSETWPSVEVESGQNLIFVDMSTLGETNSRRWLINGDNVIEKGDSVAIVPFYSLGEKLAGEIVSKRSSGTNIPADEGSKLIPLLIKVIPSSQPFIITENASLNGNDKIEITVSGALAAIPEGLENDFTVHVQNDAASYNEDVSIKSVALNPESSSTIVLTLNERVYNTDLITIEYSGTAITSVDTRVLQTTTEAVPVKITLANLVKNDVTGFEKEDARDKAAYAFNCWVGKNNVTWARTLDQANSGLASMKHLGPFAKKKLQARVFIDTTVFPEGEQTYKISFKMFMPASNTMTALAGSIKIPFVAWTFDGLDALARDKWVTVTKDVTLPSPPASGTNFLGILDDPALDPGITGDQVFFIDDISMQLIEPRQ